MMHRYNNIYFLCILMVQTCCMSYATCMLHTVQHDYTLTNYKSNSYVCFYSVSPLLPKKPSETPNFFSGFIGLMGLCPKPRDFQVRPLPLIVRLTHGVISVIFCRVPRMPGAEIFDEAVLLLDRSICIDELLALVVGVLLVEYWG